MSLRVKSRLPDAEGCVAAAESDACWPGELGGELASESTSRIEMAN